MEENVMILLVWLAIAGVNDSEPVPKTPSETIALADKHPKRGTEGVFVMKVVAAERHPNALYLNSSADYRAPDDVTFHFTPSAAKTLEKRLGAKPETALIGRTVTVRGEVKAVPIANLVGGRPRSLNRYQHTVLVRQANQVIVQ
jgi:hypothetical protein